MPVANCGCCARYLGCDCCGDEDAIEGKRATEEEHADTGSHWLFYDGDGGPCPSCGCLLGISADPDGAYSLLADETAPCPKESP